MKQVLEQIGLPQKIELKGVVHSSSSIIITGLSKFIRRHKLPPRFKIVLDMTTIEGRVVEKNINGRVKREVERYFKCRYCKKDIFPNKKDKTGSYRRRGFCNTTCKSKFYKERK